MRAAFLLLLLANLLFLAWWQGYFGARSSEGHEPQRMEAQVSPDRIHVLKAKAEHGSAAPVAPAVLSPTLAAPAPASEACREVAPLALDDAEHVKAALAKAVPEIAVTVKPIAEAQSYWVHIPPLPNRQAAERKSAEVKRLGFAEYYVVLDEGPNRFAISLGLFGSEQAANEFIAKLAKKGVRNPAIQVREKEATKAKLELRGPAPQLDAAVITELVKKAGSALGECAAVH